MTDAATSADLGPPSPSVDVQDPLPESNWLWRRVMSFAVVVPAVAVNTAALVFLWMLKDSASVLILAKWNLGFAGLVALLYLAGANMTEIIKLSHSAALLKSGIVMQKKATAETPEGKVTAETTTGKPAEAAPAAPSAPIRPALVLDSQIPEPAAGEAPRASSDDIPDYARPA